MEVAERPKLKLSDLTLDQLVATRNKLSGHIKDAESVVDGFKEKRAKVDIEIMRRFNEQGVTSARTSAGTPYIIERNSASIADKDAFWSWMQETKNFDFMEMRASKTMVEQYKAEHSDLPPGINWSSARAIGVKKS